MRTHSTVASVLAERTLPSRLAWVVVAAAVAAGGALALAPAWGEAEPAPRPTAGANDAPAEDVATADGNAAPRPAPEASTWTTERSSSGGGVRETVTATFTAREAGAECEGTVTLTDADGASSSERVTGPVEPAGFVPRASTLVRVGEEAFVPDWVVHDGCSGAADVHYGVVVGREPLAIVVNGEPRVVDAWKAVVPESEEWPLGEGVFHWDSATGLLLSVEYEGMSGRVSTRLTGTSEPLAYG